MLINKKTSLSQKISLILFGLFLTIVILEIVLRIGGFTILALQEHRNLQAIKQKGACRIMCLGESTTQNQYPPYLEEILNQRNIGIKFRLIDRGISGINTTAMLSQLEANLDKYQPDMVITMIGINDNGSHIPYETAYSSKLITALRSFRVYKFTRLLWLHIITKLKEKGFYLQDINKQKDESKKIYEELQQEQAFKNAIELNPNNASAYVDLGWFYRNQGKLTEAEQLFKKAIELNPKDDPVYKELGRLYKVQEKLTESEQVFKRAIEFNPKNDSAYVELGWLYRGQGKLTESEQAFKKAVELNPKNTSAYVELSRLYENRGKFTESEQLLKKAIEFNPYSDRAIKGLATIYCEIGNDKLSKVYAKKADSLRDEYSNPKTIYNYRMLKQILDKKKIKLVCVQYPVRNIEILKMVFGEEADGMIFVDNERIFKDAVRKEGYKEYFKDMFGGDFGHCTNKGNKLLAENIANAILKEIFHK